MNLDTNDFELILLPGKNPPLEYLNHYNSAYRCWKETWDMAFKSEMNFHETLFSDNFTRQDEILALFYKGECIGVTFFRWVSFTDEATFEDSYFEHWPPHALQALRKDGDNILIISQFTVNFHFKPDFEGIAMRDLLVGVCFERLIHAECDAAATAVRLQKRMNETVFKVGAVALLTNISYSYGQKVDLIGYFFDKVHYSTVPGVTEVSKKIFSKVISLVHPIKFRLREVKRVA